VLNQSINQSDVMERDSIWLAYHSPNVKCTAVLQYMYFN
jgi:hypothetical protein